MVDGVQSSEGEGGMGRRMNQDKEQYFRFGVKELWKGAREMCETGKRQD